MVYLIAALWLICGVINYGFMFAYFQREFQIIAVESYYKDRRLCVFGSLFGPIALAATFVCSMTAHGFKWR